MLLRLTAAKPRSAANVSRSMGYAVPVSAALPRGITSARVRASRRRGGVALRHFHVGEQVVGKQDGLGALEVGVGGQHDVNRRLRLRDEGAAVVVEARQRGLDDVLDVEARIGGDLVVAGAARVEFAAEGADEFDQPPLDVEVDVLQLGAERERAVRKLGANGLQTADDGLLFLGSQDMGAGKGARPRNGAGDVIRRQPPVKRQGGEKGCRGYRARLCLFLLLLLVWCGHTYRIRQGGHGRLGAQNPLPSKAARL